MGGQGELEGAGRVIVQYLSQTENGKHFCSVAKTYPHDKGPFQFSK